jgi:hypothetical protein
MRTYRPWEDVYYAAIVETDYEKLGSLIDAAKSAIDIRLEELRLDDGAAEERDAISNAVRGLSVLQKEREQAGGRGEQSSWR